MTIAVMQPYLFPYIGYWQLIAAVDKFVLYDNIQFKKGGWFHRNNILSSGKKTLFTIPLKKDSYQLDVAERRLFEDASQHIKKIIYQIENEYKKAPYFNDVFPLLESIFSIDEKNLFLYIYNSITKVAEYLQIDTEIVLSSTLKIDHTLKGQEKVLAINKYLHADHYINAIGGQLLYEKETFAKAGVRLNFIDTKITEYKQFDNVFVPSLSIIDIMMFNSREEIQVMLKRYTLI